MSAPTIDWPPADLLDGMAAYTKAMAALLARVVEVQDGYRPLLDRYHDWAEAEARPEGWFETTDALFGMGRAADLAGAAEHLLDGLVYGGANNLIDDDRVAELVQEVQCQHRPS